MSVVCFIFGWLCLVLAFVEPRWRLPLHIEERENSGPHE